jgi:hypothetical protein
LSSLRMASPAKAHPVHAYVRYGDGAAAQKQKPLTDPGFLLPGSGTPDRSRPGLNHLK